MALLPKVKLKALVSFPSTAVGGAGVDVVKQNGNFIVNLDFGDFAPPVAAIPAGSFNALLWDSVSGQYILAPMATLAGGIAGDAVSDGFSYGRLNATWQRVVPLAGGTMTGPLALNADPATAMQAATKQYVDNFAAPLDALAYSGMQINGSMEVSQELGMTGTGTSGKYVCDGWVLTFSGTMVVLSVQVLNATWFPGLPYFLNIAISTAQASLGAGDTVFLHQKIEGQRISRLAWGTNNAQPITIGFWTAHTTTGIYSGSVRNGVANNRSYAFSYTQSVAGTPQYNTVTIPGDITGTWATDNTNAMWISFTMACGATFTAPSANTWSAGPYLAAPGQINGVATTSNIFRLSGVVVLPGIEAPTAARSALIMRPFDQELLTCKRYWEKAAGLSVS